MIVTRLSNRKLHADRLHHRNFSALENSDRAPKCARECFKKQSFAILAEIEKYQQVELEQRTDSVLDVLQPGLRKAVSLRLAGSVLLGCLTEPDATENKMRFM